MRTTRLYDKRDRVHTMLQMEHGAFRTPVLSPLGGRVLSIWAWIWMSIRVYTWKGVGMYECT